jgi:hypothetical protein
LITESILFSAVRALPGDGIAGHTPYIFFHTILTDTETASAAPAEAKFSATAVARVYMLVASFSPTGALLYGIFHGCCLIILLV